MSVFWPFAAFSVAAGVGRFLIGADMAPSRRATNFILHGLGSHRSCSGITRLNSEDTPNFLFVLYGTHEASQLLREAAFCLF